MAVFGFVVVLGLLAACSALPADPILRKLDPGLRYQYVEADDGELSLQDMWMSVSDLKEAARYDPDRQNIYHLFTRDNPTVSQPLLHGSDGLLGITNYNSRRRTIILVHGWRSGMTSDFITSLVPAFLHAEDVNLIVLDWNAGAGSINYATAVANTITCGESLARFISWLNAATGASPFQYHLVGHSLGAHLIGVAGRNLGGQLAYLTGLEAALPGFITNDDRFRPDDARYTEVIHTNAGVLGYLTELGHVDFYPNGGVNMPGCSSQECDHARSYFYLAESLTTGGFTGTRCASYAGALTGNCLLWGRLQMGGLVPKTGSSGIYYLETNASPPFSKAREHEN